jgi:transposase
MSSRYAAFLSYSHSADRRLAATPRKSTGGDPVLLVLIDLQHRFADEDKEPQDRGRRAELHLGKRKRRGERDQRRLCHPNQISNWKKQLLDGAAKVFEAGGSGDGTASEAAVDVLYRQIGQLKEPRTHSPARRSCCQVVILVYSRFFATVSVP